ncbi:MAG: endopeptidase La [Candidatus Eisenbacteria bacterium]|uniref:Lon protease n=1 Tax=Eiseniibacteriota bacterium TaxID=2212470 RepID=A0A538S7P2_UNCEI|nr:MAG: endopeptidase La [Candidatus Eisenbacteria bacterium]
MAGVRKRKTATEKKRAPSKEPAPLKIEPPAPPEELIQSLKPGERRELPVLPVRHTVLFPLAILPLNVGRPSSVQLLNHCMQTDRTLVVVRQRDAGVESPQPADLHEMGTLATILRMVRSGEGQLAVLVQGVARVRLIEPVALEPFMSFRIEVVGETEGADVESEAQAKTVVDQFERIVSLSPTLPNEAVTAAREQSTPGRTGDFVASLLDIPSDDKQRLLETLDVKQRLKLLIEVLSRELQVLEVGQQIQESVRESLDQHQKEFLLRQQMEAIRKELGEGDDSEHAIEELKAKIEKAQMPPDVRKEADRELSRLSRIPPQAPEYTVARTYLEWLCDMPWAVTTEDNIDLVHVREVLDEDHYGLEKIKERILEYLAVRRFKADARTPILCFVGPPGTGKTSLGRSIARALGRKFVRQSLGGVRDEAEIRGHRRTYIGALPGTIIQGLRRAGTRNPLFMLDEIDKLGADFRGDPSSALLEVLDPEQNSSFSDHYLDVPFDLSQVMFVTTANYLDPVPPALRDRMEVIELSGYTDREKLEIAKRHLLPKAIRENGLEQLNLSISDEALLRVVHEYTLEAGLRNFERELANLLRRTAKLFAEGKDPPRQIGPERVRELLGPPRFEEDKVALLDAPGAALGLAWTPVGGQVLTIEATRMPGSRQLILTGQLGDVMKESATAALSYIRSHAQQLGIDPDFFEDSDIHVHVPAGAIPKDGPSAGVALCTAMVSLLTQRKARPSIAMTGEITLRGMVLRIGGVKEKVLGAHRAGIKTVILPADNENDLEEVPLEVRTHMIFAPVTRIDQVIKLALEQPVEAQRGKAGDGEEAASMEEPAEEGAADGARTPPGRESPEPPAILTEGMIVRGER